MPSYRSNSRKAFALRPVHSVKEIVDGVFLAVSAGVSTTVVACLVVNDYTGTVGTCPIGASIKSMWIHVSYALVSATPDSNFDWYLIKDPGTQLAIPTPGATGGNVNRKWIFHESKGLAPNADDANPQVNQGWIKIPRKMTRMGESDRILLVARGAASNYNLCVKIIYKWFT